MKHYHCSTFSYLLVLLSLFVFVAVNSSELDENIRGNIWQNVYVMQGIKGFNNKTDVGPGDHVMSIFYDAVLQKRVRVDSTNDEGTIHSITVDFSTNLYYLNYLSEDHLCFFEHIHDDPKSSGPKILYPDWVETNATFVGKKEVNGILCNEYILKKGSSSSSAFMFYLMNVLSSSDFYEMHYYEDQKSLKPVRFSIENDPTLPNTNFDVIRFVPMGDRSFPKETMEQNIHEYCH